MARRTSITTKASHRIANDTVTWRILQHLEKEGSPNDRVSVSPRQDSEANVQQILIPVLAWYHLYHLRQENKGG